MDAPRAEARLLYTTWTATILVIIYLLLALLGGIALMVLALFHRDSFFAVDQFERTLLGGLGAGLVGASMYYLFKTYRSLLRGNLMIDSSAEKAAARLGSLLYQIVRPISGGVFSIIIVLILWSGLQLSIRAFSSGEPPSKEDAKDSFVHACMVICFFAGYSTATVIEKIDVAAREVLARTIPK